MKLLNNIIWLLLVFVVSAFAMVCFGQDVVPVPGLDKILEVLGPVLVNLAAKFPFLASALVFMMYARLIVKPLMSLLISIAEQLPDGKYKLYMLSISGSMPYKIVAYLLDWFVSVKLPKEQKF